MQWNDHSRLKGDHAFLSASKYHWLNYTPDKLIESFQNAQAATEGTKTHEFAALCIERGQKLPSRPATTLSLYVNDAIGFRMTPEQVLYYSENCFGTADAILFRKGMLRIHDLKTGIIPAHMEQLEIYAALFCLEYKVKPTDIDMELRIYQNNASIIHVPEKQKIYDITQKIVEYDNILKEYKLNNGYL